jgi:hypothetical protein
MWQRNGADLLLLNMNATFQEMTGVQTQETSVTSKQLIKGYNQQTKTGIIQTPRGAMCVPMNIVMLSDTTLIMQIPVL